MRGGRAGRPIRPAKRDDDRRGRRVGQVRCRPRVHPRLAGAGRGLRRWVSGAGRMGQALRPVVLAHYGRSTTSPMTSPSGRPTSEIGPWCDQAGRHDWQRDRAAGRAVPQSGDPPGGSDRARRRVDHSVAGTDEAFEKSAGSSAIPPWPSGSAAHRRETGLTPGQPWAPKTSVELGGHGRVELVSTCTTPGSRSGRQRMNEVAWRKRSPWRWS